MTADHKEAGDGSTARTSTFMNTSRFRCEQYSEEKWRGKGEIATILWGKCVIGFGYVFCFMMCVQSECGYGVFSWF